MTRLVHLVGLMSICGIGCAHEDNCGFVGVPAPAAPMVRECVARADAAAEELIAKVNLDPRYKDYAPFHLADYSKTVSEGCIHGRAVIVVWYQLVRWKPNRTHFLDGPSHFDVAVHIDSDEATVAP